jgi:hypothetical protein
LLARDAFYETLARIVDITGWVGSRAPGRLQIVLDRGSIIWKHFAEGRRRAAVADDLTQKADVAAHGLEGAERIQQHKAEFEAQTDFLQRPHRLEILLDGDLFDGAPERMNVKAAT